MTRTLAHIGNGAVYLLAEPDGTPWINVDLEHDDRKLAKDDRAAVDRWGTTSDKYYAKHRGAIEDLKAGRQITPPSQMVCDVFGDWNALPFEDASVDLLWSVQTFEHLSNREAVLALAEARRVLKPGGVLRLCVPDFDESLKQSHEAFARGDKLLSRFIDRHILGSRKDRELWTYHHIGRTKAMLLDFLAAYGFQGLGDEPPINEYPSIHHSFLRLDKSHHPEFDEHIIPWKAAYEYAGDPLGTPLTVPDDWTVLEVGPGTAPWPRANIYVDKNPEFVGAIGMANLGKKLATVGTVEDLHFGDKGFAFVLASHVLEHVDDPRKAAAELSRVSKAGCVICPSPFKEGLFAAHELDHKWWVFQSGGKLLFKRIPEGMYEKVYNPAVSGQMHRMFRYGDPRLESLKREARAWWKGAEMHCDVIHRWGPDAPLRVEVLE